MSTVREFLTDHAHVLGTAGAVLLLGWVLLRLVAEALVWARAWRHARTSAGCTRCGAARVDVVAYPSRTEPAPYCIPCLLDWPEDSPQPPPMVGLRRPVDGVGLFGQAIVMFFAVLTAVVLVAWAVGS